MNVRSAPATLIGGIVRCVRGTGELVQRGISKTGQRLREYATKAEARRQEREQAREANRKAQEHALREIIERFGTAAQRERLAEGYMNLEKEARATLESAVFGPLREAELKEIYRHEIRATLPATAVTDADWHLMKAIKSFLPDAQLRFVQTIRFNYPYEDDEPQNPREPMHGVEVKIAWRTIDVTKCFAGKLKSEIKGRARETKAPEIDHHAPTSYG